jgi:hypothetical protein
MFFQANEMNVLSLAAKTSLLRCSFQANEMNPKCNVLLALTYHSRQERANEIDRHLKLQMEQRSADNLMAADSARAMPRVMPPLDFNLVERFNGEIGRVAKACLQSWEDFGRLFQLEDDQLVALARLMCCGDYARTWANQMEEGVAWAAFRTLFYKEFCEENVDRLQSELLNLKQETSVGKYAVALCRILAVLSVPVNEQIRCFMRGLKHQQGFSLTFAANPKTLEEAIEVAKRTEAAYEPVHHGEVSELVERPTAQTSTEFNRSGTAQLKALTHLTRLDGTSICPRCLQEGHLLKSCTRDPKAEWFSCCQYWSRHRRSCKEGRLMRTP